MNLSDKEISNLKAVLSASERIVVLTGSGVSAESGIPTFRGNEGYWDNFSPQDLASPTGYKNNPDIVWRWYLERRKAALELKPNPAHFALAQIEKYFDDFVMITQNIDNMHQRAGSKNVYEIHGSLFRSKCNFCEKIWQDETVDFKDDWHICPYCKTEYGVRPDVVWFGEPLPADILELGMQKSMSANIFISAGTSGNVYPAAELPYIALRNDAFILECNLDKTQLSRHVDIFIGGKAGISLPKVLEILKDKNNNCEIL